MHEKPQQQGRQLLANHQYQGDILDAVGSAGNFLTSAGILTNPDLHIDIMSQGINDLEFLLDFYSNEVFLIGIDARKIPCHSNLSTISWATAMHKINYPSQSLCYPAVNQPGSNHTF